MQQRATETKAKILHAARDCFSAMGFHGTTVDKIANTAGVNKQRIYAYYQSKENLFTEALRQTFLEVVEDEESFFELTDRDIPRLGEIILRRSFEVHRKHKHFWRLLAWENLEGGRHAHVLKGLKSDVFAHLEGLYRKGQHQGIFKQSVSFEAFYLVLACSIPYFYSSNKRTMTRTLGIPLEAEEVEGRFIEEICSLMC